MDGEIDGEELQALREDGEDVRIVDIRQPNSFRRGHIPGSQNVPFAELPQRVDEIADADRVVTVCPHGKASVKAARLVGSYGAFAGRVDSLEGGLEAWDGPIEADGEQGSGEDEGPEAPF
jgi:rhodanese-related sulfurtransferase